MTEKEEAQRLRDVNKPRKERNTWPGFWFGLALGSVLVGILLAGVHEVEIREKDAILDSRTVIIEELQAGNLDALAACDRQALMLRKIEGIEALLGIEPEL